MIFNGVKLPDDLRVALEEGKLVIFVGAGVSMPPPSSLPTFNALVRELAGWTEDAPVKNPEQTLGGLVKQGKKIHEAAARRMLTNTAPTDLHKEIVRLFGDAAKVRVVTTNFDNHFTDAAKEVFPGQTVVEYHAPALPLGDDFEGIVYLHGCARIKPLGQVLTDKDFGMAYLTRGWARDFLISLFGKYTVAFVGYSHNDVVVSYLARGMNPAEIQPRSVFVPSNIDSDDTARWDHLEIKLIPHTIDPANQDNERQPLTEFFRSWAAHQQRTILDHASAIAMIAAGLPPEGDADVEYLLYCLRHPRLAQDFCNAIKHPAWVGWMEAQSLFEPFFTAAHGTRRELQKHHGVIAYWLCSYVRKTHPELLLALIQRNHGAMSGPFAKLLGQCLWAENKQGPEPKFAAWVSLLLVKEATLQDSSTWSYLLKECEIPQHAGIALRIFDLLTTPNLHLEKYFDFSAISDATEDEKKKAEKRHVDFRVEWQRESDHWLPEIWITTFKPNLPALAEPLVAIITKQLISGHDLLRGVGKANERYDSLSWSVSSIAPHEQNRDALHRILSLMVEIARDLLDHWLANDRVRAIGQLDAWWRAGTPLLRRLVVYGVSRDNGRTADQKLGWLLDSDLLFRPGLKKEVFDLLAAAYPSATDGARQKIITRIQQGLTGADTEGLQQKTRTYEIFNALQWLKKAKPDCAMVAEALMKISDAHPEFGVRDHLEFDHWHGKVGFLDPKDGFNFDQIISEPPDNYLTALLAAKEAAIRKERWDYLSNLRALFAKKRAWGEEFMKAAVQRSVLVQDLWYNIFSAWRECIKTRDDWIWILERIEALPRDAVIYGNATHLLEHGLWLDETGATLDIAKRGFAISVKAWDACHAAGVAMDDTHQDWLTSAINHPGGWIGTCWVDHANFLKRLATAEPPSSLWREKVIEAVNGCDAVSVNARIAMTPFVAYLFAWDADLVKEHFLPLFDWKRDPIVAQQSWSVMLGYERGRNQAWEKMLIPYYRQFAAQMSALLKGATEQQEQFNSHSQQALGWHLASLAMAAYENPVTSGFFRDFLPLLPPAVLTAMTSAMGEHLAHQSPEEQRKAWDLWVKEYLEKRILGIPVSISSDEADEFAGWCIPLSELFPEMVQLLSKMPVQNMWSHKIVEDLLGSPLVEKHPAAACAFILLVLRAEKYPLLHDELVTLFKKFEQTLSGSPAITEFEQLLYLRGWKR